MFKFYTIKSRSKEFLYLVDENEDSTKVIRHLELIDDEAAEYGVRWRFNLKGLST